ncbi:MAG: type III pantothenate kinase [Lachnospiraceae bacterium]|nr:type III pantothenate kinase [Lachnospiraceae bacterium]
MIMAVDVGNTNITLGMFKEKNLMGSYRLTSKRPRTSDEYGSILQSMLDNTGITADDVDAVIIASVVPKVMHSLVNSFRKYIRVEPFIVNYEAETGIKFVTENPAQIGADRIVDSAAGYALYGGPIIVIDFGTATTYDLISEKGEFLACVIAPGIQISANAMWGEAAKLPEIEIKKPKSILGRDTVTSMQAGVVYGQIGQTEYMVNQMKKEAGLENIKVVATGGLGSIIANETDVIQTYDPLLTLKGLQIIYEMNKDRI